MFRHFLKFFFKLLQNCGKSQEKSKQYCTKFKYSLPLNMLHKYIYQYNYLNCFIVKISTKNEQVIGKRDSFADWQLHLGIVSPKVYFPWLPASACSQTVSYDLNSGNFIWASTVILDLGWFYGRSNFMS